MSQRTPYETVDLYIRYTSNEGRPEWVPKLCADPIRRHDPNKITEWSHAQQMERIRGSELRAQKLTFTKVVLHGEGPYVTWIWNMSTAGSEKRLCGIEVFKVENELITDVWNSSYVEGAWDT